MKFILIYTIIVYTGEISIAKEMLDSGNIIYKPKIVYLSKYSGDNKYDTLSNKIYSNAPLTELDAINLCLLPLMKSEYLRGIMTEKAIELTQHIKDTVMKNKCIELLYLFVQKFVCDEKARNKLQEAYSMTDIGEMIVNDTTKKNKEVIISKILTVLETNIGEVPNEYKNAMINLPLYSLTDISMDVKGFKSFSDLDKYLI
ncbi:hypothetical protein [Inconstantimicrobium porci]|uniref:Uncharacterized protein n=1 Tax=Inconstantimicrobium porci TaxID=2652291 RepID=A0A7X2MYI0_9CLOT|nr:hypothetical protein [Inconstantimicrobium porci]MSR91423.1 hypothetical protein [Inconstantimicrobium porci]